MPRIEKTPPVAPDNTPEEDGLIRRAIANDPDTWEAAADTRVIRRARPSE